MDAVYLVSPFWNPVSKGGLPSKDSVSYTNPYAPENRSKSGMPDPDALIDRYSQIMGWDPRRERNGLDWQVAQVFHHVKSGTITHGIQARTISGQASSEFSHLYFENTKKSLDAALEQVRQLKEREDTESKL